MPRVPSCATVGDTKANESGAEEGEGSGLGNRKANREPKVFIRAKGPVNRVEATKQLHVSAACTTDGGAGGAAGGSGEASTGYNVRRGGKCEIQRAEKVLDRHDSVRYRGPGTKGDRNLVSRRRGGTHENLARVVRREVRNWQRPPRIVGRGLPLARARAVELYARQLSAGSRHPYIERGCRDRNRQCAIERRRIWHRDRPLKGATRQATQTPLGPVNFCCRNRGRARDQCDR